MTVQTKTKKNWISRLVSYLRNLKLSGWANSIDDLPDGKNEMEEHLLLLWKHNADFDNFFVTENDGGPSTPQPAAANSSFTRCQSPRGHLPRAAFSQE